MQKLGSPVAVSIAVDMPFNKQLYYSNKGAFTNYVDLNLPILDHLPTPAGRWLILVK